MRGRLEKKAPNNNLTHHNNHLLYLPVYWYIKLSKQNGIQTY